MRNEGDIISDFHPGDQRRMGVSVLWSCAQALESWRPAEPGGPSRSGFGEYQQGGMPE